MRGEPLLFLDQITPEQRQLIELAARVPPEGVPAAKRMLESLIVDPFWLALRAAPSDDEPLTSEEQAAIEEARESIRRGGADLARSGPSRVRHVRGIEWTTTARADLRAIDREQAMFILRTLTD